MSSSRRAAAAIAATLVIGLSACGSKTPTAGTGTTAASPSSPASSSPATGPSPTNSCADDMAFLNTVLDGYARARTAFNTVAGQTTARGRRKYLAAVAVLRGEVDGRTVVPSLVRADRNIQVGLAKVVKGAHEEFAPGASIAATLAGAKVLITGDGMVGVAKTQIMTVSASGSCT